MWDSRCYVRQPTHDHAAPEEEHGQNIVHVFNAMFGNVQELKCCNFLVFCPLNVGGTGMIRLSTPKVIVSLNIEGLKGFWFIFYRKKSMFSCL